LSNLGKVILGVGACLILIFAFYYDWFYDEAWTWQAVQEASFYGIFTYNPFYFANNHLLNSIWVKCVQSIGIHNLLVIRFLSVISGIIFFLYSLLLFEKMKVEKWKFLLIIFTPFILFFSQARGYALSFACLSIALYYITYIIEENYTWKYTVIISLSLSISILANFSFVFFNSILLVILLVHFLNKRQRLKGGVLLIVYLVPLLYTLYFGLRVNQNDMYIIGSDSFLDLFLSLAGHFSYSKPWGLLDVRKWPIVLSIIVLWLACVGIKKTQGFKNSLINLLLLSLVLSLVLVFFSHILLGSAYPVSRATLVYVYIILMVLILGSQNSQFPSLTKWSMIVYLMHSILICVWYLWDLQRPNIREILRNADKNNQTLYVWSVSPAYVQMTRDQNYKIFQSYDLEELDNKIALEIRTQEEPLIILKYSDILKFDLNSFNVKESTRLQRGMMLYKLQNKSQ
jgi:hypothetical protein